MFIFLYLLIHNFLVFCFLIFFTRLANKWVFFCIFGVND